MLTIVLPPLGMWIGMPQDQILLQQKTSSVTSKLPPRRITNYLAFFFEWPPAIRVIGHHLVTIFAEDEGFPTASTLAGLMFLCLMLIEAQVMSLSLEEVGRSTRWSKVVEPAAPVVWSIFKENNFFGLLFLHFPSFEVNLKLIWKDSFFKF